MISTKFILSEEEIKLENERRIAENEKKRQYNEWVQKENAARMAENERRLAEWKQKPKKSPNCAKCGLLLEGETVELEEANKEFHKKCFGCTNCGKKIGLKPILIAENPYCEVVGNAPLCYICSAADRHL